jgi:phage-related minor tail protein
VSDLDLGTLVANLRLDGAQQFNRDVDRAGNAFTDLADQAQRADRQISQIQSPRSLTQMRQDADQARGAIGDIGDQGRRTSNQLRDVGDGMGQARRSIQQDTQAARRDVDQLGNAGRQAGNQLRQGAEEGSNAFSGMLDGLSGRISDQLGDAGDSGGGAFVAGAGSKIMQLGSKAGPWGIALAAIVGTGAIAGAKLADAVMDGFQIQSDRSFAATKFGWTGDQLAQAGAAAGDAYSQTFGESVQANIDTVGTAIQTGLLDGDATAEQMQPVIEQLTTVSQLMGTEIPETARAAGQMIKTGLAKDSADAMDQLTVASQKGLNVSDDLLDTMTEYGVQWQKIGIDGKTALGTISQMFQGGVRDADLAADALKEFSIRVIDGSESTADAFTSLGLNADDTAAAFGKGGQAASSMADTVIDKLRGIQDPVERNRIGVELFGTQWEDVGQAINNLDLSKAAGELGNVGGAAQRAADNLSSGPGAMLEKINNTISVFSDTMKVKLAEAFGPAVEDLANGLLEHKDEIISFFTQTLAAGLQFGVALGNVAAGLLHVWGWTTGSLAKMFSGMVTGLGQAMGAIGGLISHIPGLGSVGNAMQSAGEMAQQTGKFMAGMGDAAHGAANYIADNLVPAMAGARNSLLDTGNAASGTARDMDWLTDSVLRVPNSKSIIISDNSPETRQKLEALGYTVRTLPNGQVEVVAKTEQAEADMHNFVNKPRFATVIARIWTDPNSGPTGSQYTQGTGPRPIVPDLTGNGHADGGQVFGPGGPRDDAFLVPLSNREWVQPVSSVDYYGNAFMADVQSRRFPRILARGYADGGQVVDNGYGLPSGSSGSSGFPDWVTEMGQAHGVTPATYAGHQESDRSEAGYAPNPQHLNRGIDWTGSVDSMQAFAEYMMAQAASDPAIEQVIWMNPNTGQKLGWHGRSPDNDGSYYASDYGGHTNHVHTRFGSRVGAAAAATGQQPAGIQDITLTSSSSREDVARKIIAEGRKRGYTDDQIADILSMAIQESNLDPNAVGGGGEWKGIFQQNSAYPGRDDPNTQITGFYDTLDKKKTDPGWSQNMDDNLFWVQQAPSAETAQAAVANGRGGYMTEINQHQDEATKMLADLGPSVGTLDAGTGTTGMGTGDTINAFVTNWPAGLTTSTSTTTPTTKTPATTKADDGKTKPTGPLPLVAYADGGWGGPAAAEMLDQANAWITLAGEAGRELYLPIDGSAKSKAMWLQAGKELGMVRAYADGGFGGYSEDTSDWMAPKSWQDYVYLAAGAGFTAASVIGPYASMAAGFSDGAGEITLGDLAPQPSTGSNDIPGLSNALSKQIEVLDRQLTELKKLRAEGKQVYITVKDQTGLLERAGIKLVPM